MSPPTRRRLRIFRVARGEFLKRRSALRRSIASALSAAASGVAASSPVWFVGCCSGHRRHRDSVQGGHDSSATLNCARLALKKLLISGQRL